MSKVLVVCAHPDDESILMGGTLYGLAQQHDVHVVSMGTGVGARVAFGETQEAETERRQREFYEACKILGATCELRCEFPDQMSDTVPQLHINRAVEHVLAVRNPDAVYTHFPGDLNLDHRRVAEAVLVATRMGPIVACMEPEFPSRGVGQVWEPNRWAVIDRNAMNKKVEACLRYTREMRAYPHPRSEEAIRLKRNEAFMEIR